MTEIIITSLNGFWSSVLAHLWQVTLILVPLFLAGRWLKRAPAGVTHALWSTGLIKLFLPLALFGGMIRSVFQLFPETLPVWATQPANTALAAVTTVLTIPVLSASPQPPASESASWLTWAVGVLSVFWIAGVVWLLARLAREIMFTKRIGGSPGVEGLPPQIRSRLDAAYRRAGILAEQVKISDVVPLPCVIGFFKPMILIPHRLISHLSDDELVAVLVHEDAHRRRFDLLQSVAHRICAALFFFYPLIWPLLRRLREAAEFACDDAAIRKGIAADIYARAVSKTLQLGLVPAGSVSMAGAGNVSFIKRRLDRLTSSRRSTMSLVHKAVIVVAVVLVGLASFWPLQLAVGEAGGSDNALAAVSAQEKNDQQKDDSTEGTIKTKTVKAYTMEPASKPPKLIESQAPYFPEEARKSGTGAHVVVKLLVRTDGTADSVTVDVTSKGHSKEFEKAVFDAASKWRFEPAENDDGEPVEAWVQVKVQFNLDNCDDADKEKKPAKTMVKPKSESNG